jgi:Protein of unknown function (DUF3352)
MCKRACRTCAREDPCTPGELPGRARARLVGALGPAATIAPVALHSRPKSRRLAGALILASIAWLIAGCGSSHEAGTTADPAGAVPASAPLYGGASVRPGEPLRAAARAAGRALTHQADPYLRLLGALRTPGSPALDFKRDVAPWLGVHAGIFLSSLDAAGEASIGRFLSPLLAARPGGSSAASSFPFGAHGAQGAFVLDTSDAGAARSFLDSQARRAGAHAAAYRGVSYRATAGGIALGVVDRFAVIGSEPALRSVIDTTLGGPALVRAAGYSKLLASAPSGALAHLYASAGAFSSTAQGSGAQGLGGLVGLLAGARPVNLSLVPSTTSVAVDADALASTAPAAGRSPSSGLFSSSPDGARALGELPGESWLAIGLGEVGATLGADAQALQRLASLGSSLAGSGSATQTSSSLSVNGLLKGILTPLSALGANSAEARKDFQSWMGSAGIFAGGSGLLDLKGAIVIASKNPALSRAAVAKLAAKLRSAGGSVQAVSIPGTEASAALRLSGLPVVLDISDGRDANGQSKFVIGLGEASVAAALHPSSTLSGAASRGASASALGEGIQPSVTVDFPTLLSLLEGVGLSEDPTIAPLLPYLRSLTTLAGGGVLLGGGIERLRFVVGLRPAA